MFKSAKFSLSNGRLEEFAGIYGLIFNNQTFIILFCGIATYVGRHSSTVINMIGEVAGRLHHRGPDGSGVFHIGSTVLAHRRLSIIDIAGENNPYTAKSVI